MATISVIVPTYQRPDYLDRCVRSLFRQSRLPDEVILVSRDTDRATNERIVQLQQELGGRIPISNPQVARAGFLPPVERGIKAATGDIVAFLDDDAEAFPDWLERMAAHYADERIGGAGGRCINYFDFKLVEYPPVSRVGVLSWYGRSIGNMYKDTTFDHPVEVEFFMGGNMSFRRSLLQRTAVDPALNNNVGFYWELDMAQQVRRLGYRLLFDPAVRVNHYSAPRETDGLRTINYEGVFHSNHNYSYLMMKHLPLPGRAAYLVYTFLVGSQLSSGVIHAIVQLLRGRRIDWHNDLLPSIKGRVAGISAYLGKTVP